MNFEIFGIVMPMWVYIIVFTVCQFINVGLNTAKTIIMHKEEKISSSIINAITFGFYAIIVVMTASALPLWITILITFATNLFGVYGSMWLLDKFKKDSLWEIVATIKEERYEPIVLIELDRYDISYNYLWTDSKDRVMVLNIYSKNQKESAIIKKLLDRFGAKYIVHEERAKL
jgi:hypothetical protein